jgi:hypothetical protein
MNEVAIAGGLDFGGPPRRWRLAFGGILDGD